jgi:hypothetical protein
MTSSQSLFSFNDILDADWQAVLGKSYVRTDTGEIYGKILAKYPKECGKLSALFYQDSRNRSRKSGCQDIFGSVNLNYNSR